MTEAFKQQIEQEARQAGPVRLFLRSGTPSISAQ